MNFNNKAKLSPVVMLLLSGSQDAFTTQGIRINNNDSWDDIAGDNKRLS